MFPWTKYPVCACHIVNKGEEGEKQLGEGGGGGGNNPTVHFTLDTHSRAHPNLYKHLTESESIGGASNLSNEEHMDLTLIQSLHTPSTSLPSAGRSSSEDSRAHTISGPTPMFKVQLLSKGFEQLEANAKDTEIQLGTEGVEVRGRDGGGGRLKLSMQQGFIEGGGGGGGPGISTPPPPPPPPPSPACTMSDKIAAYGITVVW